MKSLIAVIFLFSSLSQAASSLTLSGFDQNINDVKIAKTATLTDGSFSQSMSLLGAGLRAKKIAFISIKVYVGQFFVQDPASFKKTESDALNSISAQKAVAMHLTFLREVDSKRFVDSFKDSFKINNVDTHDAAIQKFLDIVAQAGDVKDGASFSVTGYKKDDKTEVIVVQSPTGDTQSILGTEGLRQKVFSLWFGKTDDSGVKEFKKSVLK